MSLSSGSTKKIKILFIYSSSSRQDENLRQGLESHLSTLKNSGVFMKWCKYPLDISHFYEDTNNHTFNILNTFDVVALLVNSQLISLIQNTTFSSTEIQHILQRGKQEEIVVVPLLMREVHGWEKVLGDFNPLPKSRIAVKKSSDTDGAFVNIAEGLEEIIDTIKQYHQNLHKYKQIFYTAIQEEYPLSPQALNTLIRIKQNFELKNKDIELVEQEIIVKTEQEYNQKLQRYKQEFFKIIRITNSVSEQNREKLKILQNDLSLKDEIVAIIENEVIENISLQPIRRLISYENQPSQRIVITTIVIIVAGLLGFCQSSSETEFTNLENQGQNKLDISVENIDYMKRANDHYGRKNYQAAIDNYTTAIRVYPDSAEAYENRGYVYDKNLRNQQQAIKNYQKAVTLYEKQGVKKKVKEMRHRLKRLQQKNPIFAN
ncbi:MAG: tetratricopeptide repeat protein [Nostoc sp. ChiQUE01a]|nr:tetratricopeptide repeat protein [Nostoc sp. ChiQUE01a]